MSTPVFHLLAGPNGAGKSTLYGALVASGSIAANIEFVNADLYEQSHLQHIADPQQRSVAARKWADKRREELLAAGQEFVSETVFSHESKLRLISHAQSAGFSVVLYVVSVEDPARLLVRVRQRVKEGGHNVPPARIVDRYPRAMANLKQAVLLADVSFVYDAIDIEEGGHTLVALCEKGQPNTLIAPLPLWAATLLNQS